MSFRHIVVPLDGSVAARRALVAAAEMAPAAERCIDVVVSSRTAAADVIVQIQRRQPDLVTMVRRPHRRIAWFGRDVANAIIAAAVAPVMLIPEAGAAGQDGDEPLCGRSVVLPLDTEPVDNEALTVACAMARSLGGVLVLGYAVAPPIAPPELPYFVDLEFATLLWDPSAALNRAEKYLRRVAERAELLAPGVPVRTRVQLGWCNDVISSLGGSEPIIVVIPAHLPGAGMQPILRAQVCPVVVVPVRKTLSATGRRTLSASAFGSAAPIWCATAPV